MPELKGMLTGLLLSLIFLAFAGANWGLGSDNYFALSAKEKFLRLSEGTFIAVGVVLIILLGFDMLSEVISEIRKNPKILPAITILVSAIILTAIVWFLTGSSDGRTVPGEAIPRALCPGCNLIVIAIDGLSIGEVAQYRFNSETGKLRSLRPLEPNSLIFEEIYSPVYGGAFSEEEAIASGSLPDPERGFFLSPFYGDETLKPANYSLSRMLIISETAELGYSSEYFSDYPANTLEEAYGLPFSLERVEKVHFEGNALSNLAESIEKIPNDKKFAYFARSSESALAWQKYSLRKYPFGAGAIRVDSESGKAYREIPLGNGARLSELKGEDAKIGDLFSERKRGLDLLDSSISEILSALKKKGLLGKTVIVITSTYPLPFTGKPLHLKDSESGIETALPTYSPFGFWIPSASASNIPLIIYVPRASGGRTPVLGTSADIVPTALAIIGINSSKVSGSDLQAQSVAGRETIEIPFLCSSNLDEETGIFEYSWTTMQISKNGFSASNSCCATCGITTIRVDRRTGKETEYSPPRTDLFKTNAIVSGKGAFSVSRKA